VQQRLPSLLDDPIAFAHRGARAHAQENTLEAFELGWKLGCIPESDLRTTRDGVIVAFHDDNFSRVVKDVSPALKKKGVKDVTFDELAKLDVGSWKGEQFKGHRVSRISEVFALMHDQPQRRLYMDIKNVDLKELAREVDAAGVATQVILASTKYDVIRAWKKFVPDSATLLWMGGKESELLERFAELRKNQFAGVTQLQIHTHLKMDAYKVTRDTVDPFAESDEFLIARGNELREHDILYQTLPYGGSSPGVYAKLLDLGLMSFATDHSDVTWAAVKGYYATDGGK